MKRFEGEFTEGEGGSTYPTEEVLDYLKLVTIATYEDALYILSVIESAWWMPGWGIEKIEDKNGNLHVFLHTGGWSGNEDIIDALKSTIWFWKFHKVTRTGGHYQFLIEKKS